MRIDLARPKGSCAIVRAASLTGLLLFAAASLAADSARKSLVYGEVVGEPKTYTIRRGDSVLSIARGAHTDPGTLLRVNGGKIRLRPKSKIRVPSLHILPARLADGVVLNIPERAVYVFRAGRMAGRYPVAVGMKSWPTPTGAFEISAMIKDPVWVTPVEMVRREGAPLAALPPQKRSPLGDRWMGWCESAASDSEVGFHGTHDVNSIGKLASHACVRLYPEHARRMYEQVYEGIPVLSLYEPIKVGKEGDTYYVSVSPDIYGRGKVTMARALELLKRAGADKPDLKRLKTLIARQDGYPYAVARVKSGE